MKLRFPLAAKITLLAIANFAVLGLVFAVYLHLQTSGDMKSFLMTAARERIVGISNQIALDLRQNDEDRARLLKRYSAEYGVSFYLFSNDGAEVAGDPITLPSSVLQRLRERPGFLPRPPRGRPPVGDVFLVETNRGPRYWVGVRMPIPDPNAPQPIRGTLIVASSSFWTNTFFFQLEPWLVIGGVASLISALWWFPFVRGATHAVHKMLATTHIISKGKFDIDASSRRRDELGELGASINRMAAQLDSLVRSQKRFLADAAHELRSPLGRMQLAAGILERKADPGEACYVADLKEDIEMLSGLTDELITFARAEIRPETPVLRAVDVGPAIEKAVHMEKLDGAVQLDIAPELKALGDEAMLCRSVANVLRNSHRYARNAGPILLSAKAVNGSVLITVSDSGPGVPEETLEKIFQPFYRLDESRDRRTGGAGLGLAIVKTCVEACGGTVACHNRQPSGLETTLKLRGLS